MPTIAILVVQALIKYGPVLAEEIATLLHTTSEPTLDDWKALFAKVKTYDQYVAPVAPSGIGASQIPSVVTLT